MSHINHLQVILPQALSQLRATDSVQQAPVLLDWLRQGTRQRLWLADDLQHARLDPWQHSLLHAFDPQLRAHGLASATMMLRGEGAPWVPGSCLQVELVHLQAGLDDLRLLWPPLMTAAEQGQLFDSLQPLLAVSGFDLHQSLVGEVGRWYAVHQQQLELETWSPRAGFASRVYDIMPQGADGAQLRRLMTEAQMLLHDHPVNRTRERHGEASLNALWFWGAAPLELASQSASQRVLADSAYMRGLCEHLHLNCWPLPPDAHALLSVDAEQVLLVLPHQALASLESAWLQPLQAALQRGDIERMDVHLDHWRVNLHGGRWQQLRRAITRGMTRPSALTDILA